MLAMVLYAAPIPMAQRHPRDTHATPCPRLNHQSQWHSPADARTCREHAADAREHARTLQQNQGKHGPPPRPTLKNKNSSLCIPEIRKPTGCFFWRNVKLFREADPSFTQALEVEVKERIFAPQEYLLHLASKKQAECFETYQTGDF